MNTAVIVLVVLNEEPPGVRIAGDEVQHRLPGLRQGRLVAEGLGQKVQRGPRLVEAPLARRRSFRGYPRTRCSWRVLVAQVRN